MQLELNQHVWIVDNFNVIACFIKEIHDDINKSDPMYELAALEKPRLPYWNMYHHRDSIFTDKKSAIIQALNNTHEHIERADDNIALARCAKRLATKRKKQLETELAEACNE